MHIIKYMSPTLPSGTYWNASFFGPTVPPGRVDAMAPSGSMQRRARLPFSPARRECEDGLGPAVPPGRVDAMAPSGSMQRRARLPFSPARRECEGGLGPPLRAHPLTRPRPHWPSGRVAVAGLRGGPCCGVLRDECGNHGAIAQAKAWPPRKAIQAN